MNLTTEVFQRIINGASSEARELRHAAHVYHTTKDICGGNPTELAQEKLANAERALYLASLVFAQAALEEWSK